MTNDLETLKMSAIQKGTANSQFKNHLKDFTAQTANKGTAHTSLPSTKSHNTINLISKYHNLQYEEIQKQGLHI